MKIRRTTITKTSCLHWMILINIRKNYQEFQTERQLKRKSSSRPVALKTKLLSLKIKNKSAKPLN